MDPYDVREIVGHVLSDSGDYVVHSCSTGQDCLDSFAEFDPQRILLDFAIPQMNGEDVLKALQQVPNLDLSAVPAVFFTSRAGTHHVDYFFELGVSEVLMKPFDSTTLASNIESIWSEFHGVVGG